MERKGLRMNQAPEYADMEKLQSAIQTVSQMNFYLWMYLAQEGIFEEAHDFVREKLKEPLPFDVIIHPWVEPTKAVEPSYPF